MEQKSSGYKWIMFVLGALLSMIIMVLMLAPAPLMTTIMTETGWDAGAAGGLMSIISLLAGIFVFVGSPLMDKLGLKSTSVISMAICCIGGILAFFAGNNYGLHYIGRILFGIGYGMSMNIFPVIIAVWFPSEQQPMLQGIRTALSYLGQTLAYYIIMPIYNGTGSWQATIGIFGIIAGAIAILFLLFGKNEPEASTTAASVDAAIDDAPNKEESGLIQAVRCKEVWLLLITMLGMLWAFNTFNTYLPTYLELEKGYSTASASAIAGLMPIAGLIGGIVMAIISTPIGRRKPFGWSMVLLTIIGILMTVYGNGLVMILGIFLVGFAPSGWTILYSTLPAELPESNPAFYGGAMAIIIGLPYLPCYFIPNIFQALWKDGSGMSISTIFLLFGSILIVALIPTFFVKETGPKARK